MFFFTKFRARFWHKKVVFLSEKAIREPQNFRFHALFNWEPTELKNNFFMSETRAKFCEKKRLQKVSNFDLKMWYLSKTDPDDSIYTVFDFGYKPIVWNLHGGQFSTLSLLQHRDSSWRKKNEEVTFGYLSGQINFGDLLRKNVQNKTLSENTDENRFTLEQVIPML